MMEMATLIKSLNQTGNPKELMTKLAAQNPAFSQIKTLVDAAGGDYRAAFFNAAKAKGYTDEQVSTMVSQLSQFFSKA